MKPYIQFMIFVFFALLFIGEIKGQGGLVDSPIELEEHTLISSFTQFSFSEISRNYFDKFADMLNVEGEFFLDKEWTKGTIYFKSKQKITNDSIRYFVYGKEMHVSYNGKTMAIINQKMMDSIVLKDHKFVYQDFVHGSKMAHDYLELLSNHSIKLYKHYSSKFIKAKEVSSYQEQEEDRYVIREKYYIGSENEAPHFFKPSKKNVISLFANEKKEVQEYVKKNNLKYSQEADLVQVFNYFAID
ncbi:hypothetical protein [Labilibaculum sp.]|uniref:hypothetical protein n=1 Tax=Labilibaculum sp. TaxID=2060723 RepID=UPI003567CE30